MGSLTREEILAMQDIQIKPIRVKAWKDREIYIAQLTRGEQDMFLQRQFGSTKLRTEKKSDNQEISAINIYGHDAWLVIKSACDANGKRLFENKDEEALAKHNGEAIGFIAEQVLEWSGMKKDVEVLNKVKNSSMTPSQSSSSG